MLPTSQPIILLRPPREPQPEESDKKELHRSIKKASDSARTVTRVYRTLAAAVRAVIREFDELHLTQQRTGRSSSSVRTAGKEESRLPEQLRSLWERCRDAVFAVFDALRERFSSLCRLFLPGLRQWRDAFLSVLRLIPKLFSTLAHDAQALWRDCLSPLLRYLLSDFIPSLVNGITGVAAPVFSTLGTVASNAFSAAFNRFSTLVFDIVNGVLLPTLENVQAIFSGMFHGISAMWDAHGQEILDKLSALFAGISDLWAGFYAAYLAPAFQTLGGMLDGLWDNHLSPLWDSLTELFAAVAKLVLDVWNEHLIPLLKWLSDFFSPVFNAIFTGAAGAVRSAAGSIMDVVRWISESLHGLIDFLSGAFAGSWQQAWNGICRTVNSAWNGILTFVRGGVNSVIDFVNTMMRAVAAAVNGVVGALNTVHISIPRWVPVFGGRSFGIHLPTVSAPQIPRLAAGAVIPPGAEFLAVLGDQKHGRNLEAPESLIRQIVREESGVNASLTAEQPIEVLLDGEVLYRAMAQIHANRGARVSGFFSQAY